MNNIKNPSNVSEVENLAVQSGILARTLAEIADGKRQIVLPESSQPEDPILRVLKAHLDLGLKINTPEFPASPDAILGALSRELKENFLSENHLDLGTLNDLLSKITTVKDK